ncbi:OmcA/MtrC family decaheme c-type cytochrome [Shewanella marina]|uniref:OmcA/MtrC family decaheme c-type cytochrome n=1 Tax=Shewanella marina TaxID=487319 RepID=UPI000470D50C|nr:OmcA/MtrC family decaheme c-type cytochrome [Shewanella marina]
MHKKNKIALILSTALVVGLSGCGDDGKDGEPGTPGGVGMQIDMANEAVATITSADYSNGVITVNFELTNDSGVGLYGLTGNNKYHDFRFSFAQLQQADDSELKQWHSLLNNITNDAGTTFEQGFESIKDCIECLQDHNDGSYSYQFKTNLLAINDPAGVVFDPTLTQRIAIEMQFEYANGHELAENAHFDWIPSTNARQGVATRDLVRMKTCYTCHQPDSLKAHGGRRLDMENCQSCHNPIVSDPKGVSVELGHMIHAIHMGKDRVGQDVNGDAVAMPYTIAGYGGDHAFDYPAFPTKPAMDCTACHVNDDELADKDLWLTHANGNACVGCHTATPKEHKNVIIPEGKACAECHTNVDHLQTKKPFEGGEAYEVMIEDVVVNADNISFSAYAVSPDGTVVTGEQHFAQGYTAPVFQISWDIEHDHPMGSSPWEREIEFTNKADAVYKIPADGKFVVTNHAMTIPAGVSIEILPIFSVCFDKNAQAIACDSDKMLGKAYIKSVPYRQYVDDKVVARRDIIDGAKCTACHGPEIRHKMNGIESCAACHTSDQGISNDGSDAEPQMRATGLAWKVHRAKGHFNPSKWGGSGTILKTDCETCHITKEGKVTGIALGRSTTGRVYTFPEKAGIDNTFYASADAGSCLSCHWGHESPSMLAHIEANGGYYGPEIEEAQMATEACSVCHSPDKLMQVHGH